jgi:AAA15 family ATPase/GTPase
MIFGDIGIGRLVPVPLMGEGMGRLLTILLAIAEAKGGLVMVDEIDTGFHYSILRDVWLAIARAARENDVQILATTHSWECVTAAHESFAASETYDLRIHRLDRIDESVTSVTYDRETAEVAVASGLEMRG